MLQATVVQLKKDYYKILGVPKDASQDDIKEAFHSVNIITVQNILRYLWFSYDLLTSLIFHPMECYFSNFVLVIKVDPPSTATGHTIAILSEVKAARNQMSSILVTV